VSEAIEVRTAEGRREASSHSSLGSFDKSKQVLILVDFLTAAAAAATAYYNNCFAPKRIWPPHH